MAYQVSPSIATWGRVRAAIRWTGVAVSAAAVVGVAAATLAQPAAAQQKGAKQPAPAAKQAGVKQADSPWVKLCDQANVRVKGPDGKDGLMPRKLCLTVQEQLDLNTGMPIISAQVREAEGVDKQLLSISVPLGVVIPAGMKVAIVDKATWDSAVAGKEVDQKKLKIVTLNYTYCLAAGCSAEVEATKEIIADMRKGAGILVRAVDVLGRPTSWGVPLSGFSAAHDGPPTDNQKYTDARRGLMMQIEKRYEAQRQAAIAKDPKLAEAYKKMQEAQKELATVAKSKAAEAAKQPAPAQKK